ncbi:MAG: hypothetical protein ABI852_07265 [Gemmatimonadaceae bacterium]
MTETITSTTRYRRLLPTFVVRVGVLRFGVTRSRDIRVGLAITPRYDATAIAGERTP